MFLQPLLLAIGFTNLAMLGWLAAAAAPLLIHLWSRHRFREAPWAAMQFLLAAMRKNARRMRLQQWLLLAVRTLLIVLVVLAVAEPYGEQLVAGSTSAPAHKLIVLDGSFSMAYRNAATTNFERAKTLAATLVRDSRPGDTFTVILMANPPRRILGRETVDPKTVAAQIGALQQPHTGADLNATIAAVDEALTDSTSSASRQRQEVYFFTDLQRTTWQRAESSKSPVANETQSAFRNPQSEISQLAQRAAITVIDVGQPRESNLAVTRFATPEPFVTLERDIPFEVALRQFGQEPQTNCKVELLVDDVPVAEQTVDVPAGGEITVRFLQRFQSPGDHTLLVRAAGDRLPVDNSRWLVAPVREEVRVLCVAGRQGAAKYLADALSPNPAASSAIRPIIVSEAELAELELSQFDCIFLCNVAQFTASEAERLARYAARGGGVVFFLGDRVIPGAYNELTQRGWGRAAGEPPAKISDFGSRISDLKTDNPQSAIRNPQSQSDSDNSVQPLLPARIGEFITEPQFGLDPLDYRHPIVAPFRGSERAGLLTTPVARYYQLETSPNRGGVEIVAAVRGGDPFIVAAPLGRGRTILVATDASLSSVDPSTGEPWTIWPTWPSFLPIVRELLAFAVGGQHAAWQQPVGTSLGGSLAVETPASSASDLQIMRPDRRTGAVNVQTSPDGLQWNYSATDVSGIYSLQGLPQTASRQFAINVDTTESDLAKADPEQLPPEVVVRNTWQNAADSTAGGVLSHTEWNERLLWIALAILFIEPFLAWQFGRGAA